MFFLNKQNQWNSCKSQYYTYYYYTYIGGICIANGYFETFFQKMMSHNFHADEKCLTLNYETEDEKLIDCTTKLMSLFLGKPVKNKNFSLIGVVDELQDIATNSFYQDNSLDLQRLIIFAIGGLREVDFGEYGMSISHTTISEAQVKHKFTQKVIKNHFNKLGLTILPDYFVNSEHFHQFYQLAENDNDIQGLLNDLIDNVFINIQDVEVFKKVCLENLILVSLNVLLDLAEQPFEIFTIPNLPQ